ncbi:MAG: alpha/beta fold hydrolase [Firmicutes bacterium]|nr:alpha/beta fold hydrolase [Bacillota bacterium]
MKKSGIVLLVVLCTALCAAITGQATVAHHGMFVVFFGDQEIGYEEFAISSTGITTAGSSSVGGQTIAVSTVLRPDSYELNSMGVTLTGKFQDGKFKASAGPAQLSYVLPQPYMVVDNNVFAQYQQVIDLAQAGIEEVSVLTPALVLMSQQPVLLGKVWRGEKVYYAVGDQKVEMEEYGALLAESVYVRILAHEGKLTVVEVPAQGVKAVLRGYENGQTAADDTSEEAERHRSEEFRVEAGDVTLAGTLTLPQGEGPFPAVLLNSGSGPQDRDGNTPPALMTSMFRLMAEYFTELGIAVLRYDERGVGESTGDYNAATFSDLMDDIRALIAYLKGHPEIDQHHIVILGHSEGGVFAPILASEDPDIAGIVLLGAPSAPLDKIMIEQLEHQASLEYVPEGQRQLLRDQYLPLIRQAIADAKAGKSETMMPLNLEWLRQHMAHDPAETIKKVKQPVLLIHGEEDVKVLPYHSAVLEEALRQEGNDKVESHVLPKTTHEFTMFPYDNLAYDPTDPWKTPPELYEIIGRWLTATLLD